MLIPLREIKPEIDSISIGIQVLPDYSNAKYKNPPSKKTGFDRLSQRRFCYRRLSAKQSKTTRYFLRLVFRLIEDFLVIRVVHQFG
jgi:hypothetical protein